MDKSIDQLNKITEKPFLHKLLSLLLKKDKKIIFLLVAFSVFIALIEAIGVTAIMPFISIASDFDLIHSEKYYSLVYDIFSFESDVQFVIAFGVVLIIFYLFRGVINLLYYYSLSRFSQTRYHMIACGLFKNYMNLPYKDFINRNSSVMTKTIVTETFNLSGIIFSSLFILSEVCVVVIIYGVMIYVDYKITLVLTLILTFNSILMVKTISVRIKNAGVFREKAVKNFYEIINRSFGNYKLIKLYSNFKGILESFDTASYSNAKANIKNNILSQIPRLFLESIAFTIIILLVMYFIWMNNNNISNLIALISLFVLALYRLMPSASRIMSSYNTILFNSRALEIIHNDLRYADEGLGSKDILFKDRIILENLSFKYEESKYVLKDVNLTIEKGLKVGFIGESGSGKSTLVDIIMGLYSPQEGRILSDNTLIDSSNLRSWRRKIGYIPQSVYLFDGTVAQNVTFGMEYDESKVDEVLKKAQIHHFLATKNGQNTRVGEGGVMLSGGQKQRVAIARALYTDPEILVLDEATSSLDDKIEKEVMSEIFNVSKNKTLIIIAHRVSTLYGCEQIYRVEEGRVTSEPKKRDL